MSLEKMTMQCNSVKFPSLLCIQYLFTHQNPKRFTLTVSMVSILLLTLVYLLKKIKLKKKIKNKINLNNLLHCQSSLSIIWLSCQPQILQKDWLI